MPTAREQEIYIVMTFFLYKRLLKRKKRVDSWHRINLSRRFFNTTIFKQKLSHCHRLSTK